MTTILWSARTNNRKTDDIPTAWVGGTREESKRSCAGCPLLGLTIKGPDGKVKQNKNRCYSQHGTPAMGHSSMVARLQKLGMEAGQRVYSLAEALANRSVKAKAVRMSAIGDGARCNPTEVRQAEQTVRKLGLSWLSYTHFPSEVAPENRDLFVASAGSMAQADEYLAAGFTRATAVVAWDWYDTNGQTTTTPAGNTAGVCPALWAHSKGKRVSCNDCRRCDPKAKGWSVVLFPDHGPGVKSKIKRAAAEGKAWAVNLSAPL